MARFLTLSLCLVLSAQAFGETPQRQKRCFFPWISCPSLGCCPDDYCRKPSPCIQPLRYCGGCDDYCLKPMPCIRNIGRCGECDDYCRKPMPTLLCPPCSPFLQCGPSDCQCAPTRQR